MVDLVTGDGLPAMRFALANPRIVRDIDTGRENAFERLTELFEVLSGPDASLEQELRLRSALLSVNIVLLAAQGLKASDEQIAAAARSIAHSLVPRPGRRAKRLRPATYPRHDRPCRRSAPRGGECTPAPRTTWPANAPQSSAVVSVVGVELAWLETTATSK